MTRSPSSSPLVRLPRLAFGVIALVLSILAAVILTGGWRLRAEIRRQIVDRVGEALLPVAMMEIAEAEDANLFGGDPLDNSELLAAVIQTNELRGVLDVRLYDGQGRPSATLFALDLSADLLADDVAQMNMGKPVSRFHSEGTLSGVFGDLEMDTNEPRLPLVEVVLPLSRPNSEDLIGAARLVIDGESVAREFARLDRNLAGQAAAVFSIGGLAMGLALGWAFLRLERANSSLRERSQRLTEANRQLALSARTSALGAVTAHLVHGLKNPLSGLQAYVHSREDVSEEDARSAAQAAQRMKSMIDDVVAVVRDTDAGETFDFTVEEIGALVMEKTVPHAVDRSVELTVSPPPSAEVDSHRGNLISLILINLVDNAVEACPMDGKVALDTSLDGEDLIFRVRDNGPGLSPPIAENLFSPVQSTKPGGAGIGLVICRQLALHMSADLAVETSAPGETVFRLRVPLS